MKLNLLASVILVSLTTTSFANGVNLQSVNKQMQDTTTQFYSIDANYPQIKDLQLNPQQHRFNQEMQKLVINEIKNFHDNLSAIYPGKSIQNTAKEEHQTLSAKLNQEHINWRVLLNDKNLLSLQIVGKTRVFASHTDVNSYCINYDLATGKMLTLGDLFQPNTAFLQTISQYSREQLPKQIKVLANSSQLLNGTTPDPKNFQHWNLTPQGLLITFDAYQVGPDTVGTPQVIIPYSVLKSQLKPQFWNS